MTGILVVHGDGDIFLGLTRCAKSEEININLETAISLCPMWIYYQHLVDCKNISESSYSQIVSQIYKVNVN